MLKILHFFENNVVIGVCKQVGVETQSSFGYPVRSRPASKLDYFALGMLIRIQKVVTKNILRNIWKGKEKRDKKYTR